MHTTNVYCWNIGCSSILQICHACMWLVALNYRPIWSCRYLAEEDVGRGSSTMVLQRLGIENSHCKAIEKFDVWCLLQGFLINGNGVDVEKKRLLSKLELMHLIFFIGFWKLVEVFWIVQVEYNNGNYSHLLMIIWLNVGQLILNIQISLGII